MPAEYTHEFCHWETAEHKCNVCAKEFKCARWIDESFEECVCRHDVECATCEAISEERVRQYLIAHAKTPSMRIIDVPLSNQLCATSNNMMEIVARIATDGNAFAQVLWSQLFPNETATDFQARIIREGKYAPFRLHATAKNEYIHALERKLLHESVVTFDQLTGYCVDIYEMMMNAALKNKFGIYQMGHPYRAPGEAQRVATVIEEERREIQKVQQVSDQHAHHKERHLIIKQLGAIQEQLRIIEEARRAERLLAEEMGVLLERLRIIDQA